MTAAHDHERDDADLAAEYVLGVLDGAERRAVERRAATDAAFAQEIDAWAERLGPLAQTVPAVVPPASVWARIAGEIDWMTRRAATPAVPRGRRVSPIWQWLGLGGMGLAVTSLAMLILVAGRDLAAPPPVPGGTLTATLLADGARKRALQTWLNRLVEAMAGRILNFNTTVAAVWGRQEAEFQRKGCLMPMPDSFIAATAPSMIR